ncbi:hypothetical protein [Candidatus Solincola tengchongensis]|uniref:DUF6951 family protein n=1 Tax=Candidatus Solincola tengchongensis TaxID=2900693 RepID=UPI00257F3559|nr:hypothetical protein [Candidatus Solincola tengchongensis]
MAIVFVKGGQCGKETVITARKSGQTTVALQFETPCEHIAELAEELRDVNPGSEMTLPMRDTAVYRAASEHCCRNSCIVPAATLKAVEVAAGLFAPEDACVNFLEDAL